MRLSLLHCLAARDRQTRAREEVDALEVAALGELSKRAGEQVIASRARGALAVLMPRGRASAAELGAVDQVVVDERGNMRKLDRNACAQRLLAPRRCQVDEQRTQSFAAGRDGVPATRRDKPGIARNRDLEPVLELVQVWPGLLEYRLGAHSGRSAV